MHQHLEVLHVGAPHYLNLIPRCESEVRGARLFLSCMCCALDPPPIMFQIPRTVGTAHSVHTLYNIAVGHCWIGIYSLISVLVYRHVQTSLPLLLYLSATVVQVCLRSDGPPEIANNVFLLRANLTPQRSGMDHHYRIHLYFLAVDEDLLGMVERRRSRRSRRGTFPASNGQFSLLLGLAHRAVGCVEVVGWGRSRG
jgi:hypothetical protein